MNSPNPLRVLVTGSRTWTDTDLITTSLHQIADGPDGRGRDVVIVHGACPRGADAIAAAFVAAEAGRFGAQGRVLREERHPADWRPDGRLNRRAGFERNAHMVNLGADICVAFIRDNSPGASHTARLAEEARVPTVRHHQRVDPGAGDLLAAALACAARGWRVFPLQAQAKWPALHPEDKCPRAGICTSGHVKWEQRASADPERIRRCWQQGAYNVGIATGPSGLVVIDLDIPKPGEVPPDEWALPGVGDGADVLAVLCERHGQPWPGETFTVRTRRGGMHLYFTPPPGVRLRNTSGRNPSGLGWLIDTRAHGGYVLAPGSFVDLPDGTGPYEVIHDVPPARLPDWLAGLLTPAVRESPLGGQIPEPTGIGDLSAYGQAALKGGIERVAAAALGGRNATLNNNAYQLGQLVGAGILPEELVATALYEAASVHFGPDPAGIPPSAARATIRAALAAGIRKPRQVTTRTTTRGNA